MHYQRIRFFPFDGLYILFDKVDEQRMAGVLIAPLCRHTLNIQTDDFGWHGYWREISVTIELCSWLVPSSWLLFVLHVWIYLHKINAAAVGSLLFVGIIPELDFAHEQRSWVEVSGLLLMLLSAPYITWPCDNSIHCHSN